MTTKNPTTAAATHTRIYSVHAQRTRTSWQYTIVRDGRVVLVTSDYKIVRSMVPELWLDTSKIPDQVWM